MVMEAGERINDAEDWVYTKQCGCQVTFLGSCFHHTSRMIACSWHSPRNKVMERSRIVEEAREALRIAKMNQPPR